MTTGEPLAVRTGDSVAVNGCCLTVVSAEGDRLRFDVVPETLARTSLGDLAPGDPVNLETALRAGEPMGGHWVQGHVDAVGTIRSATPSGNALDVEITAPPEVLRYCVDRGSITVDGVSLTVMGVGEDHLRVSLIPETRTRTNLGHKRENAPVNLEVDILAKYVERLLPR